MLNGGEARITVKEICRRQGNVRADAGSCSPRPGQYQVGAGVSDRSVIPFYGVHNYNAGTRYSEDFYISSEAR